MPNIKSAKKRVRVIEKKTLINMAHKTALKTAIICIISPLSMYKKRSYKIVTPLNDFYASFASLRASCDFFLAALFL